MAGNTARKLPVPDQSDFGKRLKLVRLDLGLSAAKMADELDVKGATYKTWERFNATPHIGREVIARRVHVKWGYDEEWLLHGGQFSSYLSAA